MSFLTQAYLSFGLSNYRSSILVGEEGSLNVVYDIKCDEYGRLLQLKNNHDLLDLPGTICLQAHDGALDQWNGSAIIGTLDYLEPYEGSDYGIFESRPERFSIKCLVPKDILNRIVDFENVGAGPSHISVTIAEGIKYGPDPDSMKWESEKDWVPVKEISFTFGRESIDEIESAEDDHEEPENGNNHLKDAILDSTLKAEKNALWIISLLIVISVLLAIK
jgi:hypothetical protein